LQEALKDPGSLISRLPQELGDIIKEQFPSTVITFQEAEAYRLALMEERTLFTEEHLSTAYGVAFNMCEH
jgi:hypothetical protein